MRSSHIRSSRTGRQPPAGRACSNRKPKNIKPYNDLKLLGFEQPGCRPVGEVVGFQRARGVISVDPVPSVSFPVV